MDRKEKVYVIYHKNCTDGTAAAYAAWKKFGNDAIYIPMHYNDELPELDITGFNVRLYIVDFSFDLETLLFYKRFIKQVQVIDHHKGFVDSFVKDLVQKCYPKLSKCSIVFKSLIRLAKSSDRILHNLCSTVGLDTPVLNMHKSGALLAWEYFHPNKPVPDIIKYVSDRDLWEFKYPETKAVVEGIHLHPEHRSFEYWDRLAYDRELLKSCIEDGRIILKHNNNIIERNKSNRIHKLTLLNGYKVAIFNATYLISEMCEAYYSCPDLNVDYVISYYVTPAGRIQLSFRSAKSSGVDVGMIAAGYGGGGHFNASGACLNHEQSMEFMKLLQSC